MGVADGLVMFALDLISSAGGACGWGWLKASSSCFFLRVSIIVSIYLAGNK